MNAVCGCCNACIDEGVGGGGNSLYRDSSNAIEFTWNISP